MNSEFKLFDDRIKDTQVENAHFSLEIQKKGEEMDKQIDNLRTAQRYLIGNWKKLIIWKIIIY